MHKNTMNLSKYDQSNFDRGASGFKIIIWWFIQGTLFRLSLHNMYRWRVFILKIFGAKIGKHVKIRSSAKFTYPWKISIGDYSWIGDDVVLYSLDCIDVGSNTVISQKSYLCTGSHDIYCENFSLKTKPIKIGDSVWIATDSFVHPGVVIGSNSVVTARSTIRKSVDSNVIVGGPFGEYIKDR
ncbi:WcaF family extracellular polysaccharide biosynthesis acetyltransferase [Exiguobacterium undae]|uniref:Colanic acid biosynthesis acetyltransferase WcaF n=1 Tax=Exiguobacterium undae TaxID=169177 RepID=A0ABX2V819_9BACL|nr:WcaF family extracellular polysaccharide biosynthesis acetyltransferase [Exiguobacterium undae]OAN14370.1 colanic acid biosynthesis acetyltransferase WcaF [Exiguobacterium undae]